MLRNDKQHLCTKILQNKFLHIAMAIHSFKTTYTKFVLKISYDVTVTLFLKQFQQNIAFLFVMLRSISVKNLSKIGQETKKLQEDDVVSNSSTSFSV